MAKATVTLEQAGEITLPGRKLLDLVKALLDNAKVAIAIEGERATIRSGKSRFNAGHSAGEAKGTKPRVIDISADYRYSTPSAYEAVYKYAHGAPNRIERRRRRGLFLTASGEQHQSDARARPIV